MTQDNDKDTTREAQEAELRKWIESQFQGMARHVVENELMGGERAEGRPIWALPKQLFIGKIWDKDDTDNAWWIISGAIRTDHLQASVADQPREVLRHFCLKWQLQSARLEQTAESDDPEEKQTWTGIAGNLAAQAEALFKLVEEDRIWQQHEPDH